VPFDDVKAWTATLSMAPMKADLYDTFFYVTTFLLLITITYIITEHKNTHDAPAQLAQAGGR
jgi:hypothetical protein